LHLLELVDRAQFHIAAHFVLDEGKIVSAQTHTSNSARSSLFSTLVKLSTKRALNGESTL